MLGKMMKQEWKGTWKAGCLMLGGVAMITFLGWLAFQTPMWRELGYSRFGWMDVLSVLTLLMYVIMLGAVHYGVLIYLGVRFYRTMYTDEGYLTHTLPVTEHQILISKILMGGLWGFLMLLAVYLSLFLLGLFLLSAAMPEGFTLSSMWKELAPEMKEVLYILREDLDLDIVRWLIMAGISSFITPLTSVAILFGAISIGQLVTKYRVLMAIVSYIVISVAMSIVGALVQNIVSFSGIGGGVGRYLDSSINTGLIVDVAAAVLLYFISWYVNSRKLNLP